MSCPFGPATNIILISRHLLVAAAHAALRRPVGAEVRRPPEEDAPPLFWPYLSPQRLTRRGTCGERRACAKLLMEVLMNGPHQHFSQQMAAAADSRGCGAQPPTSSRGRVRTREAMVVHNRCSVAMAKGAHCQPHTFGGIPPSAAGGQRHPPAIIPHGPSTESPSGARAEGVTSRPRPGCGVSIMNTKNSDGDVAIAGSARPATATGADRRRWGLQ